MCIYACAQDVLILHDNMHETFACLRGKASSGTRSSGKYNTILLNDGVKNNKNNKNSKETVWGRHERSKKETLCRHFRRTRSIVPRRPADWPANRF